MNSQKKPLPKAVQVFQQLLLQVRLKEAKEFQRLKQEHDLKVAKYLKWVQQERK